MSRKTPKLQEFINDIQSAIHDCCSNAYLYIKDITVYYDAGDYSKRDYVARFTIVNGSWDRDMADYIKYHMREKGAVNIIGGIKHAIARDFVDFAFDISQAKLKKSFKGEINNEKNL